MLQDSATVESNIQQFIDRVIEDEAISYLLSDKGVANAVSNEDEKTIVALFWSYRTYASRAKNAFDKEFLESEMTLFDFLYRWLPGMSGDGVLVGPNWNENLIGKEIDPFNLRTRIEDRMSAELLEEYEERFAELARVT